MKRCPPSLDWGGIFLYIEISSTTGGQLMTESITTTNFIIRLARNVRNLEERVKALEKKNDDFLRKLYGQIPESYQD